jgi:hypothetical protein
MEMTIERMEIKAFKGIRELTLDLRGQSAIIAGRNGTGKTSIYDAFLWLLFGKDSRDARADVKPLDKEGNRISGLDCEVTALLAIAAGRGTPARTVELRKQWHEVWSKPLGGAQPVYARDETLCWINGAPKKIDKEYQPFVLSLVGEDETVFKLISSHEAFMRLGWADRRKMLIKITGGDADTELLALPEFASIPDTLGGSDPEDAKKRLLEQRKRHNDQLKLTPARIDELERTLQPVTETEVAEARKQAVAAEQEIAVIDAELSGNAEAAAQMNQLLAHKGRLESELITIKGKLQMDQQNRANRLRLDDSDLTNAKARREAAMQENREAAARNEQAIAQHGATRASLLDEYHALEASQYNPPENMDTTCPTCGQALPEAQAEAVREAHRIAWQRQKAADMQAIVRKGKEAKEAIDTLTQDSEARKAQNVKLACEIADMDTAIASVRVRLQGLDGTQVDPETDPAYAAIAVELDTVNKAIAAIGTDQRAQTLREQRRTLVSGMDAHRAILARAAEGERVRERIAALHQEKTDIGIKLMEVETQLALLGRFVSARCTAMEEAINRQFTTIRWKLFDIDKSGNIRDCCDATVNGVPYGGGLNNAAEINAGIEIIRVLSRAYGVTVPCFVDNAEAVNHVMQTDGQMIQLRVTEDETLTLIRLEDEPIPMAV